MKSRILFILIALISFSCTAFAQKQTKTTFTTKTETSFENAQARMPQVLVQPLVKPLVCEVEVVQGKPDHFELNLTAVKVEHDLDGNLDNVYNYGVFEFAKSTQCDMIVAATFHLKSLETGGYLLEIKGFPAKFKNWHTATNADYEWMRITGAEGAGNRTIQPIIKK